MYLLYVLEITGGSQNRQSKYKAKTGTRELQVSLYFDPQSFRHVRTQYRVVRPAVMAGNPLSTTGRQDTVYTLWEVFDNFRETDGLTLPHAYKLMLTIEGQNFTIMSDWDFTVVLLAHNQPIDPNSFSIQQRIVR